MTAGGPLLVIDTATTRAVIAVGDPDGTILGLRSWTAGYRHGEELLARIASLLGDLGLAPVSLGGLVVGTGPGAFTGLRVGIATAKGLAHALALPIAGVSTGEALLAAAARPGGVAGGADRVGGEERVGVEEPATTRFVLLQPAGMSDRVVSRPGARPMILPGGEDLELGPDEMLVAIDLDGRAPADAVARGEAAHGGLAAALLTAGAITLAAGGDDLARLVPEYVTLPRGVLAALPDIAVELTGGSAR